MPWRNIDWAVPTPHSVALSWDAFFKYLLPPLVSYYATAVLVQLPNTQWMRVALLPVTLYLAFWAGTQVDLSVGHDTLTYLNQGLALAYTTVGFRAIIWAFQTEPYKRTRPATKPQSRAPATGKANPSESHNGYDTSNHQEESNSTKILLDAWDLFANLRGVGWNWSRGLYIAPEYRTTSCRTMFLTGVLRSFVLGVIAFDFLQYSVQWHAPLTVGSTKGGSIFDPTLDPFRRYSRSLALTLLTGFTVYTVIQCGYSLFTLLGVGIFRQDPSLYPPIFNKPWTATSLREFWSRRWHQAFRDNFISLGARPVSRVFGRACGVLGAFFVSGVLHDIGVWGMGRGSDFVYVCGFFMMNGVGVLLEQGWEKSTGRRVGGLMGWIWTIGWLLIWGQFLLDAWAKTGLVGGTFLQHNLRPSIHVLGPFV